MHCLYYIKKTLQYYTSQASDFNYEPCVCSSFPTILHLLNFARNPLLRLEVSPSLSTVFLPPSSSSSLLRPASSSGIVPGDPHCTCSGLTLSCSYRRPRLTQHVRRQGLWDWRERVHRALLPNTSSLPSSASRGVASPPSLCLPSLPPLEP